MKRLLFGIILMAMFITPVYAIGGDNDTDIDGRPGADSRVDIDPINGDIVPITDDITPITDDLEDDEPNLNRWLIIGGIGVIIVIGAIIMLSRKPKTK